jgi:hypothetical protein
MEGPWDTKPTAAWKYLNQWFGGDRFYPRQIYNLTDLAWELTDPPEGQALFPSEDIRGSIRREMLPAPPDWASPDSIREYRKTLLLAQAFASNVLGEINVQLGRTIFALEELRR